MSLICTWFDSPKKLSDCLLFCLIVSSLVRLSLLLSDCLYFCLTVFSFVRLSLFWSDSSFVRYIVYLVSTWFDGPKNFSKICHPCYNSHLILLKFKIGIWAELIIVIALSRGETRKTLTKQILKITLNTATLCILVPSNNFNKHDHYWKLAHDILQN